MLSGETAKGDFHVICVKTMAKIAKEAEACIWNERIFEDVIRTDPVGKKGDFDGTSTAAISAILASYKCQEAPIVVLTKFHVVSNYKPQCPILSVTRFERPARQMQLYRSCIPLFYEKERAGEQNEQDPDGPAGNTRSKKRCNRCCPSHCNLSFHTMGPSVRSYTRSKVNPMDGNLINFAVDLDVTEKEELTDHIREGMLGAKADSITMLRDSAS